MTIRINPLARAVGIFGAVAALAAGVTFAALQSSATLTDSSIDTGNADIQVYNFSDNQWESSAPGFTITNLVPGTGSDQNFYLRNTGSVDYDLTATIPTLPGPPSEGSFGFS